MVCVATLTPETFLPCRRILTTLGHLDSQIVNRLAKQARTGSAWKHPSMQTQVPVRVRDQEVVGRERADLDVAYPGVVVRALALHNDTECE